MKKIFYILLSISIVSCNGKKDAQDTEDVAVETSVNPRLLIVPGQSIGNVVIEMDAGQIEKLLGKPDLSDAAMGKAWLTWFSKVSDTITGNELNIYTEYKDNEMAEKVVRQIRITSDEFQTADGISTGKTLDEISKIFSEIKLVGQYDTSTSHPVSVYDAVEKGIAFEVEHNVCTGIIIHSKGRAVSEEYISFHPDMLPM